MARHVTEHTELVGQLLQELGDTDRRGQPERELDVLAEVIEPAMDDDARAQAGRDRMRLTHPGGASDPVRMNALKLVSAVGMALLGACGSSSATPVDACNQEVETTCARVYECYTPAELATAGFPAAESACITQFEASEGCAAKTSANFCTTSTAVYHGEAVDGCVAQVQALSCADLKANLNSINTVAPKCAEVCVIPT